MDKHNDSTGTRFEELEARLAEFITRFDCMTKDMELMKQQQQVLIELLKQKLK